MNSKSKLVWKITAITLCASLLAFLIPMFTSGFLASDEDPVIIVLDPGHGGADTGAVNYIDNLYESDVNLAIALACRDELLRYDGVEVHMTHTGLDRSQTLSLGDRVDYTNAVDGDILISLHCNDADDPAANGSEVYVSLSTYSDRYNQDSTKLAIDMLKQFKRLGLTIRGVKTRMSETGERIYYHDDGSQEVGDYYFVIASTIQNYGIPGILVEHAFITGDAAILGNADGTRALGVADATAIAQFYGLKLKSHTDPLPYEEPAEVILVTDAEIISASDVMNSLIKLPDNLTASHLDRLQRIRLDYEKLSTPAKELVDADQSDRLYRSILQIDSETHPVRLTAAEDSGISVNRLDHTVNGLDYSTATLSGTNVSALRSCMDIFVDTAFVSDYDTSKCSIMVVDPDYNIMDIGAQVGTGTTVLLCADNIVIDEVRAVILGDINGDGFINSFDLLLLEQYLNPDEAAASLQPEEEPFKFTDVALIAADVNDDGRINSHDIDELVQLIAECN